jgi:hypothetical protein
MHIVKTKTDENNNPYVELSIKPHSRFFIGKSKEDCIELGDAGEWLNYAVNLAIGIIYQDEDDFYLFSEQQ